MLPRTKCRRGWSARPLDIELHGFPELAAVAPEPALGRPPRQKKGTMKRPNTSRRCRRSSLLAAGLVTATVLSACTGGNGGKSDSAHADPNAVLRVGTPFFIAGPSFHLDPRIGITGNENTWFSAIYAPLMKYSTTQNKYTPYLAKQVSIVDPTTVEIEIRPEAKFDNGQPVTAADAKATLDSMLKNLEAGTGNGLNGGLRLVKNVQITGDRTYTIHFSKPALGVVHELLAGREGIIEPQGASASQDTAPIGNGPFKFTSLTPGIKLTLAKSSTFFDADKVKLKGIEFDNLAEGQPQMNALRAGDIDLTSGPVGGGLSFNLSKSLAGNPSYQAVTFEGTGFSFFDMCRAPGYLFNDVRVRQAVQYGTDRTAIAESVYSDKSLAASQVWAQDSPLYDPSITTEFGYDVNKAKALLAQAGVAPNTKVTVVISSTDPSAQQTALLMKQQWAKIGLDLVISQTDNQNADFYIPGTTKSPKFQATLNVYSRPPSTKISLLFTPGAQRNACDFVDQKIIDEYTALQEKDPTDASAIAGWKQLDRYVASIAAIVPLLTRPIFIGAAKRVEGLSKDTLGPVGLVGPDYESITMASQ
jgi:peptide/nickel transport system substrate-binding protein